MTQYPSSTVSTRLSIDLRQLEYDAAAAELAEASELPRGSWLVILVRRGQMPPFPHLRALTTRGLRIVIDAPDARTAAKWSGILRGEYDDVFGVGA